MKNTKWQCVGDCCKRYRIKKGWTLEFMAEKAGFSRQYMSMFESGFSNSMKCLCVYIKLGIDIDELIHAYEADMRRW